MRTYIALLICLFSLQLHAQTAPSVEGKLPLHMVPDLTKRPALSPGANICRLTSQDFLHKASQPMNLTPIENFLGPFKTGVCWWHSRMQRSALYLAVFNNPEGEKPTEKQASQIFHRVYSRKSVVSIPGFKNWYDFTMHYWDTFKMALVVQEVNETRKLGFVRGIDLFPDPANLVFSNIRTEIRTKMRMPFVIENQPGPGAHSWLATGFSSVHPPSYARVKSKRLDYFEIIDSRYPAYPVFYNQKNKAYVRLNYATRAEDDTWSPKSFNYVQYQGNKHYDGDGFPVTLEIHHGDDYKDYVRAIENHCGGETPFTKFQKQFN